jgi:heme-degrading monooxygenase HmoA
MIEGGLMVVVVFRSRLKPGIEKEIIEMDARMAELAASMPGFVSYRQYASADGEGVAVVEFESHETAAAWRAHPEHREAQRLGRERWFSEFRITVCDSVRDYSFKA